MSIILAVYLIAGLLFSWQSYKNYLEDVFVSKGKKVTFIPADDNAGYDVLALIILTLLWPFALAMDVYLIVKRSK